MWAMMRYHWGGGGGGGRTSSEHDMTARSLIAFLSQLELHVSSSTVILNSLGKQSRVQFLFIMTDLFARFHCPPFENDILCT